MPTKYKCQNPSCATIFESISPVSTCPHCYLGRVIPHYPDSEVDRFPSPGAPIAAPLVRYSNLNSGDTNKYQITDNTDRSLTIEVRKGQGASTMVTVPAGRVVQSPAGQIDQWVLLNKNGQPDWAHFGMSKLQESLKSINSRRVSPFTLPRAEPVYLRLGFQNRTQLHNGFGFTHILFSHNRKSYDAVEKDMKQVLDATIGMDASKGKGRIFHSNGRFLLTCELKQQKALLLVVDDRDGIYNFITMYETTVADLSSKRTRNEIQLLYPMSF